MASTIDRGTLLLALVALGCTTSDVAGPAGTTTSMTTAVDTGAGGAVQTTSSSSSSTTSSSTGSTTTTPIVWGGGEAACAPIDPSPCVHPPVVANCTKGECFIPAGCYHMGSPETEYGRGKFTEALVDVALTHCFWMQDAEASQALWTAFGFPNPSGAEQDGVADCLEPECPVGNVTPSPSGSGVGVRVPSS